MATQFPGKLDVPKAVPTRVNNVLKELYGPLLMGYGVIMPLHFINERKSGTQKTELLSAIFIGLLQNAMFKSGEFLFIDFSNLFSITGIEVKRGLIVFVKGVQ